MFDLLHCAVRELKQRKWRTLASIAGYFFASAFLVAIVLLLRHDLQAKNAMVNYMGNKFLAYAPLSFGDDTAGQASMPINPQNEGFFTEPTVVTKLLPRSLAGQIARIPEIDAVTPFLLFRFKNSQDGHIFSVGGLNPGDRHALRGTLVTPTDIISGAFFRAEDRNVVVVDKSYAEMWNLKVGSVVNVGGALYPVIGVVGSHARTARADIYMNWADAETAINKRLTRPLHDEANIFLVETKGAEITQTAMKKVQEIMEQGIINAVICSLPAVKFMGLSQNTLKMVLAVVAFLILLLAMNSQWSAVSERRQEIAILKAIGWGDLAIFWQVVAEATIVAVAGGISGAVTGLLAFMAVAAQMGARVNLAYDAINAPMTILAIIAASLVAGIVSALGPAVSAARTSPAEVLRTL